MTPEPFHQAFSKKVTFSITNNRIVGIVTFLIQHPVINKSVVKIHFVQFVTKSHVFINLLGDPRCHPQTPTNFLYWSMHIPYVREHVFECPHSIINIIKSIQGALRSTSEVTFLCSNIQVFCRTKMHYVP